MNTKMNFSRSFAPIAIAAMVCIGITSCDRNSNAAKSPEPAGQAAPAAVQPGELVKVTITSQSPGIVELALPLNANGQRQTVNDVVEKNGNWEVIYDGARIKAQEQGASVTLNFQSPNLEIPFLSSTTGADVKVEYNGKVKNVSLKGDTYDWRPEALN